MQPYTAGNRKYQNKSPGALIVFTKSNNELAISNKKSYIYWVAI